MKEHTLSIMIISLLLAPTARSIDPLIGTTHVDSPTDVVNDQGHSRQSVPAVPRKQNSIAAAYVIEQRRRRLQGTPCHERPIAAREPNATVIFTGTVRDIEPDDSRPGLIRASVEIKRVLKGGYVLSRLPRRTLGVDVLKGFTAAPTVAGDRGVVGQRRVVIVEGIGDPTICYSEVQLHDTRIFFVNKAADGELQLNSSLVRITLDNIEQAEAAVRGTQNFDKNTQYLEYHRTAPASEKLQMTKSNHKSMTTMSSHLTKDQSRMSSITKSNHYYKRTTTPMMITMTPPQQTEIDIHPAGGSYPTGLPRTVDPCVSKLCSYGARCVPSVDGSTARCVCPERCSSYGDDVDSSPVCGTDGRDYTSTCEMRLHACREMIDIDRKYYGTCDPCDGFECPATQVCQLDGARRPACLCDSSGCPMTFDPVCASDGRTYSTECIMRVEACRRRVEIQMIYHGECSSGNNPCGGVVCAPGEHCFVSSLGVAHCTCPPPSACEPVLRPVCGSDGRTYDSECHLMRHSCVTRMMVVVSFTGECNVIGACSSLRCHSGSRCVVRNGRHATCVCPDCSEEFKPVCGSNDVTYTNECKLRSEVCEQHSNISVRYRGMCDACDKRKCEFFAACVSDDHGGSRCECPSTCSKYMQMEVCGTDGQTYMNECELKRKSCNRQELISVASRGPCVDPCADVECKFGGRCVGGKCVCVNECPNLNEPICATDGVTYPSVCLMRYAGCQNKLDIHMLYPGDCEEAASGSGDFSGLCDSLTCKYGGTCRPDKHAGTSCTCKFNCEAVRSPVCGSDGKSYGNECQMKEESCRLQSEIKLQPMENCEDIDEELCDGKPVLVNPFTGQEFNCLRGPCPADSYCHVLGNVARCCPKDQPVKTCIDSRFGCCSDGLTAAPGANQAGCPNTCQCNALGADSSTCDPISRQCKCKPGVGGIKCDRCNPNYWGLPKISEGNNGCMPCGCSIYGSMREDCEQMTGRCICRPGITGQKCTLCANGRQLGPNGCTDVMLNDVLDTSSSRVCADKKCHFGAVCQITGGTSNEASAAVAGARVVAECVCPATCEGGGDDVRSAVMVCGTDGQTYGSACQLKLSACRLQKDITVAKSGACTATTSYKTTAIKPSTLKPSSKQIARLRITKDLTDPTKLSVIYGKLGDWCQDDHGCYIPNSYCRNGLCICKSPLSASKDGMMCMEENFAIPSFAGRSYLQLKKMQHGVRDITVEIQFLPHRSEGLLLYAGQNNNGSGDFISITLNHGFVEFRFDLGSGSALLKSKEQVKLNVFHKLTAMRFGKDAALRLDGGMEVTGSSPGTLRSLNIGTPLYIGYAPGITVDTLKKTVGVEIGFVGCVESLTLKSTEISISYDLNKESSGDIERHIGINECGKSACSSFPCLHGGRCLEIKEGADFKCSCINGYSGTHCEEHVTVEIAPCLSNPCQSGGTCVVKPGGNYVCNCPVAGVGNHCERGAHEITNETVELFIPQFEGDSFITVRLSKAASRSLSFQIWFLTRQPNGVLLYSAQPDLLNGDFLSLNLVNGFVQLRFNLGSGIANITSESKIKTGVWNKVLISRLNRLGMLTVNDDLPVKGQSGGDKKELNLPMKLFIGGYPGGEYSPQAGITAGFQGAIQRFYMDGVWMENLVASALDQAHIGRYTGLPCHSGSANPCRNGGKCSPNLNEFVCTCSGLYTGRTCEQHPHAVAKVTNRSVRSILFDGHTYNKYQNSINISERSQVANKFDVRFRTELTSGLILLMHKSNTVEGNYLAIAIRDGRVEVSFNLGKEKPNNLLVISSRVNVTDGLWHTISFNRNMRFGQLSVDNETAVTAISALGATHLDTDGYLWIGGSSTTPWGLSETYYNGFKGCIEFVKVDGRTLDLVEDRTIHDPYIFCDKRRQG